jgi:hypothetical protein
MLRKKMLPKDPYGSVILLAWGSRSELNGYLNRRLKTKREHIGPAVRAHVTEFTPADCVPIYFVCVVVEKNKDRFNRLAALAHEILHVVLAVLEFRGVKTTTDNDEPAAYYFEWLFRLCAKEVWR